MFDWLAKALSLDADTARSVGFIIMIMVLCVGGYIIWRIAQWFRGSLPARGSTRRARLAVMAVAPVDNKRLLYLVRRDDVEHLLLIGGPTDLVVEQEIRLTDSVATPRRNRQNNILKSAPASSVDDDIEKDATSALPAIAATGAVAAATLLPDRQPAPQAQPAMPVSEPAMPVSEPAPVPASAQMVSQAPALQIAKPVIQPAPELQPAMPAAQAYANEPKAADLSPVAPVEPVAAAPVEPVAIAPLEPAVKSADSAPGHEDMLFPAPVQEPATQAEAPTPPQTVPLEPTTAAETDLEAALGAALQDSLETETSPSVAIPPEQLGEPTQIKLVSDNSGPASDLDDTVSPELRPHPKLVEPETLTAKPTDLGAALGQSADKTPEESAVDAIADALNLELEKSSIEENAQQSISDEIALEPLDTEPSAPEKADTEPAAGDEFEDEMSKLLAELSGTRK